MNIIERTNEIIKIFKKMREINLGIMGYDEIIVFKQICNTFIKDGIHVDGRIPIHGLKRIIVYKFHWKVECMLKYDDSI